jgi:hypothetical protein
MNPSEKRFSAVCLRNVPAGWRWLLMVGSLVLAGQCVAADAADQQAIKMGGAACVMAKWQGDTLDYALVYGKEHPDDALREAEQLLADKGYASYRKGVDVRHPQAISSYPFAYVIVVKSTYKTQLGKSRTSYGCGFSPRSYSEAQWRALKDLQSYSWGWTPTLGFEVVKQFNYP